MRPILEHARKVILLLIAATLVGCGGSGDEYEGFDAEITTSTPNQYLTFFNRLGDLAAGKYTLVVGTKGAGQAGSFGVTIQRNNSSATEVINGRWANSGGRRADRKCAGGNRCYNIDLEDASGATFTLNSALDAVLYLVDDSDTPRVVATAAANGAGTPLRLRFSESEIDEDEFTSAYYDAVDPMGARETMQEYIALHGLGNPNVHVVFRDSKDLGYGRDMYMRSYTNASVGSTCGPPGAVTIAFYVRNFSVKILDGFAYGPVNLEAALAEDLDHHVGTNAIEFGYGRDDVGDNCSPEPMAKFYTFEPNYNPANAPHPRRTRVDLDGRGQKAMPQPCITCHGGKLRPLDRFGRFVNVHANDAQLQVGDTKSRLQAFEIDTFEFSDLPGHRRVDYEEGLRKLNAAIYCTYPGSAGHPACTGHGGGLAAQADVGEWSGDFGREMLLGWYGNALQTPGSKYDGSFIPAGWTPSPGGAPVGADALFLKVIGPNCFVCHGKRGNELDTNDNAANVGQDLDFSDWNKFISHADEIERLVYDEGKMPMGLLNYQNFWSDPEKGELLASFIAPYVSDAAGFKDRRVDGNGDIVMPGRILARAGPDRVTQANAGITLNAQSSMFAETYSWEVLSKPDGANVNLTNPSRMKANFTTDLEGDYRVRLTASSSRGGSATDTLDIKVDNALAIAPRELTFIDDIGPFMSGNCISCHDNGAEAGIPVWWVADASQPIVPPTTSADPPALGFYEQALARVNLEVIEDSLLLKKPSGNHHFGDQRPGFDTSLGVGAAGRVNFDMFVNWIAEGGVCGRVAAARTSECVR